MQHTTIRNADLLAIPHIGGKLAVFVFIITLLAFVVESELTQVSASTSAETFLTVSPFVVCPNDSQLSTTSFPIVSFTPTLENSLTLWLMQLYGTLLVIHNFSFAYAVSPGNNRPQCVFSSERPRYRHFYTSLAEAEVWRFSHPGRQVLAPYSGFDNRSHDAWLAVVYISVVNIVSVLSSVFIILICVRSISMTDLTGELSGKIDIKRPSVSLASKRKLLGTPTLSSHILSVFFYSSCHGKLSACWL